MIRRLLIFLCLLAGFSSAQTARSGPLVTFRTTMGDFSIRLFDDTPLHRDNFVKLVREGYYDGMLFHRVVKDFMAQAGDPLSKDSTYHGLLGDGGPGYDLPAEIRFPAHLHLRGAVGAAREADEDNPERRSSGSQFYVVWGKPVAPKEMRAARKRAARALGKNFYTEEMYAAYATQGGAPWLDGAYTLFGEVEDGLDVIGRIQAVATDGYEQPVEAVRILKAEVAP